MKLSKRKSADTNNLNIDNDTRFSSVQKNKSRLKNPRYFALKIIMKNRISRTSKTTLDDF